MRKRSGRTLSNGKVEEHHRSKSIRNEMNNSKKLSKNSIEYYAKEAIMEGYWGRM